jgi:predicted MFS family arabinose efflux permease
VGVIGTGLIAFLAVQVALAWILMAGLCAATAAASMHSVGGKELAEPAAALTRLAPNGPEWAGLGVPCLAALVTGAGSALLWTFGPSLATRSGTIASGQVGWLWVALGGGGIVGLLSSSVTDRLGLRRGWCAFAALLAVADGTLALCVTVHSPLMAYGAMSVFGAGYMCLSGALILWAREVRPTGAGAATALLFIALAIGQAVGSVGFGSVRDHLAPGVLALAAAGLCALGGVLGTVRGRADVRETAQAGSDR